MRWARLAPTAPIIVKQHSIETALLISDGKLPSCSQRSLVELGIGSKVSIARCHDLPMRRLTEGVSGSTLGAAMMTEPPLSW